MLLFSTILNINDNMSKDDFIELVIEWNQTNPYKYNVIPDIVWNGERNIRFGNDQLWLDINEYRNQNIIAIRYEKIAEDGAVWDTDYVMNFNEMRMSIQLDRSYKEDAIIISSDFSTPHFITLLIERGYLKDDNDLPVDRVPLLINDANLFYISRVICGESRYQLPVVYISKNYYNEDPIDVKKLAGRLKGVAHVLLQESKLTNKALMEATDRQNDYNGSIGIYYPNAASKKKNFRYYREEGYDEGLYNRVLREVIRYCNSFVLDDLYTWSGVNSAILSDSLATQRLKRQDAEKAQRAAEEEKEDVYSAFDDEITTLEKQVAMLRKENSALRAENQGLRIKLEENDSVPILFTGEEEDFFSGEIREFALRALSLALQNNIKSQTRFADVISDLIANNLTEEELARRQAKIKELLSSYTGMTSEIRQELLNMGITITDDGKHYKLTYHGDDRYVNTLAKTPSDWRGSKNAVAGINARLF